MSILSQPSLAVAARRIIIDPHGVVEILVQFRIKLRLQDLIEHAELGLFLGLERAGIFQHFAVAIAQNVGGKPAVQPQHAHLQARRDQRLHERLAGLEIFSANGKAALARQIQQRRRIGGQIRSAVGERHAGLERRVCVNLAGRDFRIVLHQPAFEILQRLMNGARDDGTLRSTRTRSSPGANNRWSCGTARCLPSAFPLFPSSWRPASRSDR